MRRQLRRLIAHRHFRVLCGLYLSSALLCAASYKMGVRINTTASLPLGLYIKSKEATAYVSFCINGEPGRLALERSYVAHGNCPSGGYPLLKTIVALPGDIVSYDPRGLTVNGSLLPNTQPRLRDQFDRPLAHYPFGFYRVQSKTYWVASTYDNRSFDSRYYGPIHETEIREHLQPLLIAR